jgi:hypothetical protein
VALLQSLLQKRCSMFPAPIISSRHGTQATAFVYAYVINDTYSETNNMRWACLPYGCFPNSVAFVSLTPKGSQQGIRLVRKQCSLETSILQSSQHRLSGNSTNGKETRWNSTSLVHSRYVNIHYNSMKRYWCLPRACGLLQTT